MDLLREYGIKEDERFVQARKEALRIVLLALVEVIWVFMFAYLGTQTPPEQYSYIMGFPVWYFWGFLGCAIITPIVGIIIAHNIQDCELTDDKRIGEGM